MKKLQIALLNAPKKSPLKMELLLIEDEAKIAAFIEQGLREAGYTVTTVHDGASGLRLALQHTYNAIILDVMLPRLNGLELCGTLRKKGVQTPVLMLTALGTLDDRVEGLQQGADDYLVKPFHFKELLARIGALTRRQAATESNVLQFDDITLDRDKKTARRNGREIVLTAKEYALLELFMINTGRVLTRAVISDRVWGYDLDPGSNVIDVYVNYLRNKMDKGFDKKLIHTVVGIGYIMKNE